uniref:Putative cystathionine gamma-synthase/beta-lyase n=1 Tax=Floropilus chiversii TaxID=2587399 RepID=C5H887_FLOCH|nr:putative cystathionine gamma-synthase/beta-lyase [Floropilus chiversii]
MDTTIAEPENLPLGTSLPPGDSHGVSVHLPKWADTVGWASRESRVLNAMKTGYPRFFVPRVVDKLAIQLLEMIQSGNGTKANDRMTGLETAGGKLATLLDTPRHAQMCRKSLPMWNTKDSTSSVEIEVHIVSWDGTFTRLEGGVPAAELETAKEIGEEDILLISYPAEFTLEAKAFWQHTGFGISSRRATHWLDHAPFLATSTIPTPPSSPLEISLKVDQAKATLKARIAAGLSPPSTNIQVSSSNVFLFPTGMSAITEIADTIKSLREPTPSSPYCVAVFGFLYVDTYKTLSCVLGLTPILYKYSAADISAFEALLSSPSRPRLDALFTEFPGNPLLQSPDLSRLHALARKYGFVLVVDDTVGTYASLSLIGECDVLCNSLTKMFSGRCNAMGGATTLNPHSPHYAALRKGLQSRRGEEETAWFWQDVVTMEGNSRDFEARVYRASENAEMVVEMLRASVSVKEVYYPKGGPTQDVYDRYRLPDGRYGFLLSIRFATKEKAVAFYDALDVAKGPSLGTNFTLCCAYTLLAHYKELEWAAEYGVVEDLVRISVGLEERRWLEERVGRALEVAEGRRWMESMDPTASVV